MTQPKALAFTASGALFISETANAVVHVLRPDGHLGVYPVDKPIDWLSAHAGSTGARVSRSRAARAREVVLACAYGGGLSALNVDGSPVELAEPAPMATQALFVGDGDLYGFVQQRRGKYGVGCGRLA